MARKTIAKKSLAGTRKSAMNRRRKGALSVFVPWMRRFGIIMGAVVFTIWLGSWLWLNGSIYRTGVWAQDKVILASANVGFEVNNILVEGRIHTEAQSIMAIVNVEKGSPLFSFDPREARDLLLQLVWVENVHIERRLPDTIYIGVQERVPMALWRGDNGLKVLDSKGEIIDVGNLGQFKNLMTVIGKNAPEYFPVLAFNIAAEPVLDGRIKSVKWIGQRRWDVVLKNGITVKLPEGDTGLSLRRLADAHVESQILDKEIAGIDMREWDRITVRTKPGNVREYKANFKPGAKSGNNI